MLKDVEFPWPLAEIVYQHHERMSGSGYMVEILWHCSVTRRLTQKTNVNLQYREKPAPT